MAEDWSLDWNRSHTQRTQSLGFIDQNSRVEKGIFRVFANNLEFRVRVFGLTNSGPSIVLLHGFPASSIMWNEFAESAAERGYRVIAYDQR